MKTDLPLHVISLAILGVVFAPSTSWAEQPFCEAILQYGIRDSSRVLDTRSQYDLARAVHCSSTISESERGSEASGSIGFGAFSAGGGGSNQDRQLQSEEFCRSSFDEASGNQSFMSAVEAINGGVVNAWGDCIRGNRSGLSHYIEPTVDPTLFRYVIIYTPDGHPSEVTLTNWDIPNANCNPQLDAGSVVTSAGIRLLCERDPRTPVVANVNAPSGTRNLGAAQLAAVRLTSSIQSDFSLGIGQNEWVEAPPSRGLALDYKFFVPFGADRVPGVVPSIEIEVDVPLGAPDTEGVTYTYVPEALDVTDTGFWVQIIRRDHVRSDVRARVRWTARWAE